TMKTSALTITYKLDKKIDKIQIADFFKQLGSVAKRHGKLNLILETYHIDNIRNISNLFTGIESRDAILKQLRKFALITNSDWRTDVDYFFDLLGFEIEMEVFDLGEGKEADTWIR